MDAEGVPGTLSKEKLISLARWDFHANRCVRKNSATCLYYRKVLCAPDLIWVGRIECWNHTKTFALFFPLIACSGSSVPEIHPAISIFFLLRRTVHVDQPENLLTPKTHRPPPRNQPPSPPSKPYSAAPSPQPTYPNHPTPLAPPSSSIKSSLTSTLRPAPPTHPTYLLSTHHLPPPRSTTHLTTSPRTTNPPTPHERLLPSHHAPKPPPPPPPSTSSEGDDGITPPSPSARFEHPCLERADSTDYFGCAHALAASAVGSVPRGEVGF